MNDEQLARLDERLDLLRAVILYYVDVDGFTERDAFQRAYTNVSALTVDQLPKWVNAFTPS